ncbi:hypothetical protein VRU48_00300 [Pedobacter sp. KR3-3]|uniref:DUF4983 domain-containing protein n=1 Tax=Pedobacter albus TaxID=3113905 RepID=A0ABU7I233_9SPHI|nr:hypothetical protein [Pedobacter sp. KR3-3]MEE1943525.1 hypothetical protein [Pedobacter sp. KR3-3]
MKKIIKSVFNFKTLGMGSLLGFILLNAACNKDFDNVLPQKFKNDTAGIGNNAKKVLYIIVDGMRGSVVRSIAPPNLSQVTSKAIYSYDGLADYQLNPITNAAAWTTMTTGVDYTKHNVTSESFAGLNVQNTPTIFTRLKQSLGNIRTVSFASTAAFNDNLAADASLKQNFADDKSVKDAVVAELTTNNPSMLVAQFHSVETAGAANGYTESVAAYTSAITTLDGYIGEILAALRARSTYAGENWLVVIASNKGGASVSGGLPGSNIFNDASRNTYLAFYNPKFSPTRVDQPNINSLPYSGFAPNFSGNNSAYTAAVASNNTLGDFGTSGEFTVMVKVRMDHASTSYPPFVGKTPDFKSGSGTTGWVFFSAGDTWTMKVSGTGTQIAGDKVRDGIWHTLAMRIYNNGTRKAKIYTDDKMSAELNLGTANMSAPTVPFTIGHINSTESNGTINVLIKDVAIYNIAIPEADLIPYMRKTVKQPTDLYYSNLIGYWPCDDNQGSVIREASGKGVNLNYVGAPNWKSFSDISPYISPEISQAAYQAVPNGVDIPVLIYNWMNIAVPSQWNLMGKLYAPTVNYSTK